MTKRDRSEILSAAGALVAEASREFEPLPPVSCAEVNEPRESIPVEYDMSNENRIIEEALCREFEHCYREIARIQGRRCDPPVLGEVDDAVYQFAMGFEAWKRQKAKQHRAIAARKIGGGQDGGR